MDFTPIDQTLTFSGEVTDVNVTVMIVDNAVNEVKEQFTANLQLITSDSNIIINPNVTTIFIEDDDSRLYYQHSINLDNFDNFQYYKHLLLRVLKLKFLQEL